MSDSIWEGWRQRRGREEVTTEAQRLTEDAQRRDVERSRCVLKWE
jgi:hypothetical protein